MNNLRAETEKLTVLSALEGAFDSDTPAAARCCLQTALAATKRLAKAGRLTQDTELAVNEACAALRTRGWVD